jgi:tetratricopeptide (TPR) repeat protein
LPANRIEQIRKLLAKEPTDAFLNFSLAMEYQGAGQLDNAIAQFDRTIAVAPDYLAAYVRKAELLIMSRRFDDARPVLEHGATLARAAKDQHMVDNLQHMLDMLP